MLEKLLGGARASDIPQLPATLYPVVLERWGRPGERVLLTQDHLPADILGLLAARCDPDFPPPLLLTHPSLTPEMLQTVAARAADADRNVWVPALRHPAATVRASALDALDGLRHLSDARQLAGVTRAAAAYPDACRALVIGAPTATVAAYLTGWELVGIDGDLAPTLAGVLADAIRDRLARSGDAERDELAGSVRHLVHHLDGWVELARNGERTAAAVTAEPLLALGVELGARLNCRRLADLTAAAAAAPLATLVDASCWLGPESGPLALHHLLERFGDDPAVWELADAVAVNHTGTLDELVAVVHRLHGR